MVVLLEMGTTFCIITLFIQILKKEIIIYKMHMQIHKKGWLIDDIQVALNTMKSRLWNFILHSGA